MDEAGGSNVSKPARLAETYEDSRRQSSFARLARAEVYASSSKAGARRRGSPPRRWIAGDGTPRCATAHARSRPKTVRAEWDRDSPTAERCYPPVLTDVGSDEPTSTSRAPQHDHRARRRAQQEPAPAFSRTSPEVERVGPRRGPDSTHDEALADWGPSTRTSRQAARDGANSPGRAR